AFHHRARGSVTVDDGAARALVERGGSLLPAGVVRVDGSFAAGDLVRVLAADGTELARGRSNYSAEAAGRSAGRPASELEAVLGWRGYGAVIRRDNLAVNPRRAAGRDRR